MRIKNAELYNLFADYASDVPETQVMWRHTALEEEKHASQIRMAARMRGDAVDDVTIEEAKAHQMLKAVTSVFESAKAKAPSQADTLRLAIQLEEKLAAFHLEFIAHFSDEECGKMFKSMMNSDKYHIKRLTDAYQKLTS